MGTGALLSELYVPHPGSLQQHQLWDLKFRNGSEVLEAA